MNLLSPLTGAILAAAVIPPLIILYFLKLRRRKQPIASTLLWQKSIEDLRANAPFQRLRKSLLLLLQLIALLLLVLSVMQPQFQAKTNSQGKTILLIDNSLSMQATDTEDGRSRLEVAKDVARDRIEAIYAGGLFKSSSTETMIIAFNDGAEVISRFSRSRQELLDAIDQIRPTHGTSQISDALKLSRAYTTNTDPDSDRPLAEAAALELFSDGRILDLDDQVLRGETMVYYQIGRADADNVVAATIDVQRPYDRPNSVEVFAAMVNFNEREVQCDLQLSVDGDVIALQEVRLPAAERSESTGRVVPGRNNILFTPFDQPRGAVIEVTNLREDDLMADNSVRTVVPPPKQLSVAVVAPKDQLILTLLEGMPLKELIRLTPEQFMTRAEQDRVGVYDVMVLDGWVPELESLPGGRYLVFGPTPPIPGLNDFGETDRQIVLSSRDEHPIFRFVNLDQLYIAKARLLQPDDGVEILAEGSQGPVVVSTSTGPVQVVYLSFDPMESNWPFLRSFVTFVFNAVDWLGHIGDGITAQGLKPGEAIATRIPRQATDIKLFLPNGDSQPLSMLDVDSDGSGQGNGAVSWGPIRLTGLYRVQWNHPREDDPVSRFFAVNVPDEREGAVAPMSKLEIGQTEVGALGTGAGRYTPLWPYALALCLFVLMLEWWVYNRKTFV